MKLSKNLGRVATTLLATAMLASVSAVPVFADQFGESGVIDNTESGTAITSISFTKELMKPAQVTTPNKEFTFTLKNSTDVITGATYTSSGKSLNLYNGVGAGENGIEATAVFTATQGTGTIVPGEDVNTVETTVNFDINSLVDDFTDTGVYKYDIDEDEEDAPYYNGGNLDLYLFVVRYTENETDKYKVTGAVLTKDGQVDQKTDTTTNGYMVDPTDPDPTPDTNDLVITKTVDGQMGSHSEKFDFTVTLPGTENDKYNAQYEKDGNTIGDPVTLTGGKNTGIKLAHGESLRIYGLVDDTSVYTVSETDYRSSGYTTKIHDNDGRDVVNVTYDADNNDIAVVNTRNAVSPTGIVMNVAPYALLVVVAAAGCFVFLRKRRED